MCDLLDSGADSNSAIECYGEGFSRFRPVFEARKRADFGVAWSS